MSRGLDDKNALILWELAREAGRLGDGVSGEVFVRIVAPKGKSKGPRDRKALLAAVRQSFSRLRAWGEPHGLAIEKTVALDEAIDRVVFSPAALLALATRLRPRLSRTETTRSAMEQRATSSANNKPDDDVLDAKGLARMLLVSAWTARDLMRSGAFPVFYAKAARRVLRRDVFAWVESNKVMPHAAKTKARSSR